MAGYTRQDTANNIANGNVIDADDFDSEFNAVESAFNASTGHSHDGSAGEGAPIDRIGPSQDLIVSGTNVNPKTTNTLDLGVSGGVKFKDGFFQGTLVGETAVKAGSTRNLTLTDNEVELLTGALTVDVPGVINLDSDAGDIVLQDAAITYASLTNASGELVIKSGSTPTTAVTFSGADATFSGTMDVTGITNFNATTTSTSNTTGAVVIDGGVGIAENVNIGGNVDIDGTITLNSTVNIGADTLAEYISDTAGAMWTGNTESNITVSYDDTDNTLDVSLNDTAVTPGTYGGTTNIPEIIVDQQGRITGIQNISASSISSVLNISGDSATSDTVALATDTLQFVGTSGEIETTVSSGTDFSRVTFSLPSSLSISSLTVSGNINMTGTNATVDGVDVSAVSTTANAALPKSGGTMSGAIAMGSNKITGLGTPTDATDAVTKAFAESLSYTLPEATSTTRGGIELFSDNDQTTAANSVTTTANRTYGIQLNSDGQAVVNVPWENTGIALGDLSVTTNAASGGGALSYNNTNGSFSYTPPTAAGLGALTAHPSITAATSVNNSGNTFIQDITVDSNGHVTGIVSATTPSTAGAVGTYIWGRPKNNTVYSAGDTASSMFSTESGGAYWSNSNNTFYEPTHTGTSVSGTWRAMTSTNTTSVGLWLRIS